MEGLIFFFFSQKKETNCIHEQRRDQRLGGISYLINSSKKHIVIMMTIQLLSVNHSAFTY